MVVTGRKDRGGKNAIDVDLKKKKRIRFHGGALNSNQLKIPIIF